jgi:hypothetical protein
MPEGEREPHVERRRPDQPMPTPQIVYEPNPKHKRIPSPGPEGFHLSATC